MATTPGQYPGRNYTKAKAVYMTICQFPGIKEGELYRKLGWSRGSLMTALAGMDSHDLLLTESDDGGLFPFESGVLLIETGRKMAALDDRPRTW